MAAAEAAVEQLATGFWATVHTLGMPFKWAIMKTRSVGGEIVETVIGEELDELPEILKELDEREGLDPQEREKLKGKAREEAHKKVLALRKKNDERQKRENEERKILKRKKKEAKIRHELDKLKLTELDVAVCHNVFALSDNLTTNAEWVAQEMELSLDQADFFFMLFGITGFLKGDLSGSSTRSAIVQFQN
jgi:hypothetical protein